MRLELSVSDVQVLQNETGEPNAHAYKQADGELLTVIGGVVLGIPTPLKADGTLADVEAGDVVAFYAFEHDFPPEAVAVLKSRGQTRGVVGVTDAAALDDAEFADWYPGITVAVDDVFAFSGVTYRVVQAHTTQADWEPPSTPALWTPFRDPQAGPQPWVQPTGAHDAYNLGDRVTHNGQTWESTAAANVWEPGVFGWVVVTE